MIRHTVTFTLPYATVLQIGLLANDLYERALVIPEVNVSDQQISVNGQYNPGILENIIAPYLPLIEDTVWLTDVSGELPEYERVYKHKIQYCSVAPSGDWQPYIKEIERV